MDRLHHANGHDAGLPARTFDRSPGALRHLPPPGADEVHLRDYWEVLLRHRWTAIAFFTAVVASTLLATLVAVPSYKATVLIEIKAETQKLIAFQDVVQMAQAEREFYQTQYDVLRSRTLARRVSDRLRLADDPVFDPPPARPGVLARTVAWGGRLFARRTPAPAPAADAPPSRPAAAPEQAIVDRFLGQVDVSPRRNSYLVEVSFMSPSPQLAASVANALAEEYVSLSLDQRLEAVQKGRGFIEKQLGVTKAALEHSEEDLQAFARANEILTVDAKQNIEYRKLSDLGEALTKAQHERMAKEALYRQVKAGDANALSQITNNPVVASLTSELARREADRARLAETFTPEYPRMRRLQAQIDALRGQIKTEAMALHPPCGWTSGRLPTLAIQSNRDACLSRLRKPVSPLLNLSARPPPFAASLRATIDTALQ